MTPIVSMRPRTLPEALSIPADRLRQIRHDFERFAETGLPRELESHIAETYGIDLSTVYGGLPIKNPWGKASGQLSMTPQQVAEDAAHGIGFCVLKTVIAQDAIGRSRMAAWAVPESHMELERIRASDGDVGWTVTWAGRGWHRSLAEYVELVRSAATIARESNMLVVPSCKFHLPGAGEDAFHFPEYTFTLRALLDAYSSGAGLDVMPIEKDFSPTLAGSDPAQDQERILNWLISVPRLIRRAAGEARRVRVGLKLFNALFDDAFQLRMLQTVSEAGADRPDYVVYANRLFDPQRVFRGTRGVAVGGPDLSARNVRVLAAFQQCSRGRAASPALEISATGDICHGKRAVEYLLLGASSFQLHTFFQLPASEYRMRSGSKVAKALHMLYFDPENGLIAWLLHVAHRLGLVASSEPLRLRNLVGAAAPVLGADSAFGL